MVCFIESNFRPIKHIYVEDLDWRSRAEVGQTALRLTSHQTSIEMNKEARKKKKKGVEMIACVKNCGFEVKWSNQSSLKKHYSRSRCDPQNALIRKHKCHVCQRTFSTELRMKKHVKYHFEEKPHKCSECNATFIDSWGLKRHNADNVCNSHLSLERQRRFFLIE